jgi:polysaccharide pyruvyl transferase WcaK-like protein
MRILLENGTSDVRNLGDAAMLAEAYQCLRSEWPNAEIFVTTKRPDLLPRFCPGAIPLDIDGRRSLSVAWTPWRRIESHIPVIAGLMRRFRMMYHHPLNRLWLNFVCRHLQQSPKDVYKFLDLLRTVDLLVYAGGGYFNDEFRSFFFELLTVAEVVRHRRKPVVAFGQGIGPLSTPLVARPVEAFVRNLTAIGTREDITLRWTQNHLNAQTVCVSTGDDALLDPDLPLPSELGSGLGVNVRIAFYSGIDIAEFGPLREAIACFFQAQGLTVIRSIPIKDTDDRSTQQALAGLPIESCRAEKAATLSAIAKCRVVFPGSYHAAVFAYALGVTVVGLAGNRYYQQKFAGVAERFGTTPLVYTLANGRNEKNDLNTLYSLLNRAWEAAPENRAHLLQARGEQIMTNRFFKRMVFDQIRTMAPAGGRFRPCQRVEGGAYPAQYATT